MSRSHWSPQRTIGRLRYRKEAEPQLKMGTAIAGYLVGMIGYIGARLTGDIEDVEKNFPIARHLPNLRGHVPDLIDIPSHATNLFGSLPIGMIATYIAADLICRATSYGAEQVQRVSRTVGVATVAAANLSMELVAQADGANHPSPEPLDIFWGTVGGAVGTFAVHVQDRREAAAASQTQFEEMWHAQLPEQK